MSLVLLTLASCLAVLGLLALVAIDLWRIVARLDAIGGASGSYLARVRWGLRAIDTETAQLAPQVTALTEGLRALDAALRVVTAELTTALDALDKRGGRA